MHKPDLGARMLPFFSISNFPVFAIVGYKY